MWDPPRRDGRKERGAEPSESGHKEDSYLGEKGEDVTSHLGVAGQGLDWESGGPGLWPRDPEEVMTSGHLFSHQ